MWESVGKKLQLMAHTVIGRKKLLDRVRRIRGQVEAVEAALEESEDCTKVLQYIAACRGAMNGLMAEVLEGHVMDHIVGSGKTTEKERRVAAEELLALVRSYLK